MPAQADKRLFPDEEQQRTLTDQCSDSQPNSELHPQESAAPQPFRSILFIDDNAGIPVNSQNMPEIFSDLLLDQVVDSITSGRDEYNLKPFFYIPLGSVDAVDYRHAAFRDLENQAFRDSIEAFAHAMRDMRACLKQSEKLYYKRQKQRWFLDAVAIYCAAVEKLTHDLLHANLASPGFRGLRGFLAGYFESDEFVSLAADTDKVRRDLEQIAYTIHIEGRRITAAKYEPAPDYGADVLDTFEKFSQGAAKQYKFEFHDSAEMNHIEAEILDMVAHNYPETFSFLEEYGIHHKGYLNGTIACFDREVQFYFAYIEHMQRLERAGLAFCHPTVSARSKEVYVRDAFDLALAEKLVRDGTLPITNNFYLTGRERVFVVSGPNQGGKTTFARMFGQLHYLGSIGCPVPASAAQLFLFDRLFTHFEEEEDLRNLSGKLEDELVRIHRIFETATSESILIMNESFLSTTLNDALFLSRKIMDKIVAINMLCVSVTFLDELASFSEATVSMVSTINPQDSAERMFKIVRKPADGLAYAAAIAEKYRLSYDKVKSRIAATRKVRATI